MPAITGSDRALMYAQSDVMRVGASRIGYHSPKVFVSVGGVHRATGKTTASHEIDDLSITLTRSSAPNRATFKAQGWEPTVGMEMIAQLGSKNTMRRLFGGVILDVNETNKGVLRQFDVECVDWNWLLDGEPVYGHFTGTYDEIALQLMSDYAPDSFTVRQVESGLPTVPGGITFKGVKLSAALSRLAKRHPAGIVQFIDENKDLYFRATPSLDRTNPTAITGSLNSLKKFRVRRELGQVANRVPFEGGGSTAMTEVSVGETILPLQDAPDWWYGDVGGVVVSGPQKISYTARVAGGGGSLVGPGAQPSSAPTLSLAAGTGVDTGTHDITVVFVTASGRSLPSPVATISVGNVSAPTAAATAGAPSTGGSMNAGSHRYYPVFRTATGSTTAGPVSNTVTALAATTAPTKPTVAWDGTSGSMNPSHEYYYKATFRRTSDGTETEPSTQCDNFSPSLGASAARITPQTPPTGFEFVVYRTLGDAGTGGPYYAVPNLFLSGGFLIDTNADGSLGAQAPAANNTAKGTCQVTGIPVSAESLVTHVDMYREFNAAGTATAKLAFSVTNGTTSASDTAANASLGSLVPGSNTAAAGQVDVSDIAIGGSGTTARELYMSPAGGGDRKRALVIGDNTTDVGTIDMDDATLAGEMAEPTVDTSGLAQPAGQINPGSTSLLVAGTAPFRATGGWAFTGTQVIRYASFSGSSLAGIPASGVGSIVQAITYNTVIAAAPCLIGIPASGDGSILYTILKGADVNLFVTVEDTDAQQYLADLLDEDDPVVRECPPLQDRRCNRDESISRATAFLGLRAYPGVRVGPYLSKDMNNRAGSIVSIAITSPANVNDDFELQSVTISNFTPALAPDYTVQASNELFSIEDVLAREP